MALRLATDLKGRDYRDLLEIIDLVYGASCPDALFPPLFEKLAKAIGCDSAVYVPFGDAGLPRPDSRSAIILKPNLRLAREYAQYYWALDPFSATGWIRAPNRAARVTDLSPASKHVNSEFAIDFCARVPACWGLAGTVGNPGRPVGVMNLHRLRHDHDFSDRDLAFVHALLPHVSRALHFLEEHNQRPRATGIFILDDIGTVVYTNDAAAQILKCRSSETIPLPLGQEKRTFQSEQGDYAVGMQTIPGRYKVVSLEPVKRDSLRSRLAGRGLTPRQQEIASRVLWGMSNKRIAGELDLTEQTVKDHINAIFRKLGIHHRAELAARVLPLAFENLG
jgi:DNA-binding CsgD family transcriptional regulator